MSKERAPWPQCYYDELDARKRKDLLDKAIENGEGAPEGECGAPETVGAALWPAEKKHAACGRLCRAVDYHEPVAKGYGLPLPVRAAVKELSGMLKQLGIDAPQASSLEQELVYRELVHAVRLYLPPAQRAVTTRAFWAWCA